MAKFSWVILLLLLLESTVDLDASLESTDFKDASLESNDFKDASLESNDYNATSLITDHRALLKNRRLKRACPGGLCGVTGLIEKIGEGLGAVGAGLSNLLNIPPPMMGPPPPPLPFGPPMFRRRKKRQLGCCMCCCCCCCCMGRKRRSIEFVRNRRSQLQHFMHISPKL